MPVVYGSIEDRIAWVKSKKMRGELIYNIVDTEKLGCEVLASPTKCYGIADKRLYHIYSLFPRYRMAHLFESIGIIPKKNCGMAS